MNKQYEKLRASTFSRWRVYSTFLTGFLIGLFYALLASEKFSEILPSFSNTAPWLNLIDQRVMVLAFSGILGGVIYSITVDGYVEMPRFTDPQKDKMDQEDGFKAGVFGDILLGIAGAFILVVSGVSSPTDEQGA